MAFLTAEELFRMIVHSDSARKWAVEFRELELAGRFSDGAQVFIYRMQKDDALRRRVQSDIESVIPMMKELAIGTNEGLALYMAAVVLGSDLKNNPQKKLDLAVVPDRSEARQRFEGQKFSMSEKRDATVSAVLAKLAEDDWNLVLNCPRILLTLAELNLTEFIYLYASISMRRDIAAGNGKERVTTCIPQSIFNVINEPSEQSSEQALEFLLRLGPAD